MSSQNYALFQLLGNLFVDGVAKVFNGALATFEHHRSGIVWRLLPWFCVSDNEHVNHRPKR